MNITEAGNKMRSNEFALGQNFIRNYDLLVNWVTRDSGKTMLQIYIGPATYKESKYYELIFVIGSGALLLIYVSYFTVLRF